MASSRGNRIAILFDYDLTLTKEYAEDPVFRRFGLTPTHYWSGLGRQRARVEKALLAFEKSYKGTKVPRDLQRTGVSEGLFYLHPLLELIQNGKMKNLSRGLLRELGQEIKLADGLWQGLRALKQWVHEHQDWAVYGTELEYYIISNGIFDLIVGSLGQDVDLFRGIYAVELMPHHEEDPVSGRIRYVVGPMTDTLKTRSAIQISKGPEVDVNARIPRHLRRVAPENMIAVADGQYDIPVFAVVKDRHGSAIAVYTGIDAAARKKAYQSAKRLHDDGRADHLAAADYRPTSELSQLLREEIERRADRIVTQQRVSVMMPSLFPEYTSAGQE